jgi:hypothetical protein
VAITMTVTAALSGAGAVNPGLQIKAKVLTGAIEAGGNSGTAAVTSATVTCSLTPAASNSYLAWAATKIGQVTLTAATSNTIDDQYENSGGNGTFADGHYSGTVTGGTAATCGCSGGSGSTGGTVVAYEIKPSGGSTPALDASTPAVADTNAGYTLTTASFSPPYGSVIVLCISTSCNNTTADPTTLAISDTSGLGLTWTVRAVVPPATGSSCACWIATATLPASAPGGPAPVLPPAVPPGLLSPMALRGPVSRASAPPAPVFTPVPMTVTATQTGATSAGMLLRVRVLDYAAATQNGGTATQTGAASHQATVTTTQTGSKVYCAMCLGAAGPMTAATGTTLDDNYQDTANTQNYATGHATALTGTPGAITVGSSLPNGNGGSCAVAEILQNGAIGDDGTAPPVVTSNTATSLTTATFTPSPGTLLVAMMGTHWASGVTTFTVTDSLGLTWIPLAQANGSSQGYAGIWVARVPGVQPPALSAVAGLATATASVPTPSTSIQNITVDFTTAVAATSPLGIGYTISTYSGGGSANINLSSTWKNSLAALGATHCRIPLRWNGGNPGSGAGGAQTSGDADTYIANIKAIGAIPFIAFTGDTSDNGFTAADAGSFVTHYNGSGGQNGGPVRYWIVGNEPDNTGGTGPYESILPSVLTAMHGADATVRVFAPAAAYWDTALISAVAPDAVDGLDYHAYDGSNTDGTGFPTSPQYYSHIKTDLPAYKAGVLYAVTEANWHSGYTGDPNWYTWENTCFIADAAGQVLSAGGSFTQYSDSGGALSLMNDGAGTNNQPGTFGTTFPAYMGLGIWTGMAGQFKGLSANMISATTLFAQGQLSVFGCDNGKIVAVNKEPYSKTLTIGMTLPGGKTSGTYNVWATNYASPLSAITEAVTAAVYTNSTISYVIPAGTAVSIDVSTNISAGLATATGAAGGPAVLLAPAAGLAAGTGTALQPSAVTGAAPPYILADTSYATGTTTASPPVIAATAAADGLVMIISQGGTGPPAVSSVSDSKGNTWTLQAEYHTNAPSLSVWASPGGIPLTTSDTLSFTLAAASSGGIAVTAAGLPGQAATDLVTAITTGSSTAPATASGTPAAAGETALGLFAWANGGGAGTVTSPFAQLVQQHPTGGVYATISYDLNPPLSPLSAGYTITSAAWRAMLLSFQPPGAALSVTAGLATGTGAAAQPGTGLAAGLAAGTGTALNATVPVSLTAAAALATAGGTAWPPAVTAASAAVLAAGTGTALAASAPARTAGPAAGTGAAGAPGTALTPGLAAGTGTAFPAVPVLAPAAGLATATGDTPPALVTDGEALPAGLAAGTGTAQAPLPLVIAAAGLATGTGSARSPGTGISAGQATGTGTAQPPAVLPALAASLAAGTGTAYGPVASAGATVMAQLAGATGTAQAPATAAGLAAVLAAGTGSVPAPVPASGAAAVLAAGTGAAPAASAPARTAGLAAGTGTAGMPGSMLGAGQAAGTGTAGAPAVLLAPAAALAPGTGTAPQPSVATGAAAPYVIANDSYATGTTTASPPVTGATSAADGLIMIVSQGGTSPPAVTAVSDSQGNAWTLQQEYHTSAPSLSVWASPGGTALTTADTLSFTLAAASSGGVAVVAAGSPSLAAVDLDTVIATGSSTAPAVTGTPAVTGELAFGCFAWANGGGAGTVSAPFTQLIQQHPSGGVYATLSYDANPPAAPLTAGYTITSAAWRAMLLSFRTAGASLSVTAGLATATGDSPPALVTDGESIPTVLAAGTGTAGQPAAAVTVTAGLATAAGGAPVISTATAWWMSNARYIDEMYQAAPGVTSFYFNQPAAYAISTTPGSTGILDGFTCTPILKYTSYAQLQSDIAAGNVISPAFTWLMYDNEYWSGSGETPTAEYNDPWTYMTSFTALAHANGYKVMLTPSRDLGLAPGSVNPKLTSETLDQWYLRTDIPGSAASSGAEIVHIQAQADTVPLSAYTAFFSQAQSQALARAAFAGCQVSAGISTTYGAASDMAAAAIAVAVASPPAAGFWLNATDATIPEAVQCLAIMAAGTTVLIAPAAGAATGAGAAPPPVVTAAPAASLAASTGTAQPPAAAAVVTAGPAAGTAGAWPAVPLAAAVPALAAGSAAAWPPAALTAPAAVLAAGTAAAWRAVPLAAAVTAPATGTGAAPGASVVGGTVTSPALTVSGFGTFPQVPADSVIQAVIANVTWYGSDAAVTAPSYELWDGTTAIIGSPQQGTASTSPHADSAVFTGVSYSQLATLQLRIYATSQTQNSGAVAAFDAASLSVEWNPSQDATVMRPATLAIVPALPAVAVELDTAVSPGTLAVTPALPAPSAGLLSAAAAPAALTAPVTLPAVAASASTAVSPGTLAVTPALPAPSAGLLNAAAAPAVLPAAVALPAPSAAAGTGAAPGTLAVTPAFPAPSAGLLNATVTPAALGVTPALPAPAVSVIVNAAVVPAVLAVVPALPAIIDVTAPGWASSATGDGWANPGNAEGSPDGSYATWVIP